MKKFIFILISFFLITGCKKNDINSVIKHFSDDVTSSDSYSLKGKMTIKSDEEEFNYTFDVKYLKDDNYKVSLVNSSNNHEQIILKNSDAVYVITPSLNKSFKFQSSWPNNSSQSYLLASLLKDINNDNKSKLVTNNNGSIISTKVNYPNNSELIRQDIIFDKKMNIKSVTVYDQDNNERIRTEFIKVDLKANNSLDDFKLDQYIKEPIENKCEGDKCSKTTANILDDIIYPLYLPNNTYLTSSEKIGENASRVILTFAGDKSFTIVEEASFVPKNFEIKPVFGNPVLLNDTFGVISDNSVRWTRGNVDYYLTSNNLSNKEMVVIASSMNHSISVLGSK